MAGRIVVFGATGYTGRLVAERLVGAGERPVLAGPLATERLADAGGRAWAGWRSRTRRRRCASNSVFDAGRARATCWSPPSGRSPSGASPPCARRSPAGATYLDSTGEPAFIRRVFEELTGRSPSGPARRC